MSKPEKKAEDPDRRAARGAALTNFLFILLVGIAGIVVSELWRLIWDVSRGGSLQQAASDLFSIGLSAGLAILAGVLFYACVFFMRSGLAAERSAAQIHDFAQVVGSALNTPAALLLGGFLLTTVAGGMITGWIGDYEARQHALAAAEADRSQQLARIRELIDTSIPERVLYTNMVIDDLDRPAKYAEMTELWSAYERAYERGFQAEWKNKAAIQWDFGANAQHQQLFGEYLSSVIEPGMEIVRNCLVRAHDAYLANSTKPTPRQVLDDCDKVGAREQFPGRGLWDAMRGCLQTYAINLDLSARYADQIAQVDGAEDASVLSWILGGETRQSILAGHDDPRAVQAHFYELLPVALAGDCGLPRSSTTASSQGQPPSPTVQSTRSHP